VRTIVAFDPGISTGVAVVRERDLLWTTTITNQKWTDQYQEILNIIVRYQDERPIILCERFRTVFASVSATSVGIHTSKLTGWIEGLALTLGFEFHFQDPTYRAAFILLAKGYPHHSPHETDAIAHCLAFLKKGAPKEYEPG
jgi:hypothetical protein